MTVTVINSNVVGADTATYLVTGDLFVVNQGASFVTWTTGFDAGLVGSASARGVGVTILGNFIAADLELFGGDRIAIGRLGSVQLLQPSGITLEADLAHGVTSLVNEGTVHSDFAAGSDAITLTLADSLALGGAGFVLTNTGLIEATSAALFITGTGQASLLNTGTIIGDISSTGPAVDLRNAGLIEGQIQLDDGADRITITGTLDGDIDTGGGNDVIDLRHGRILTGHSVQGGTGDDTYYIDGPGILLQEASGQDRVFAGIDYTLAAGFESLVLLDGATRGTGNADANSLQGNAGDNRLYGDAGNDTLTGRGGEDILSGDLGADDLDGGAGNDRLYGGQAIDKLSGGDGEDLLVGGAGRDTLIGGQDADVFLFARAGHTTVTNSDQVTDFLPGEDLIDLSAIDANAVNALANDSFTYIGSAAFTNVAGQLRVEVIGTVTWLRMDTSGDGVADAVIRLLGAPTVSASDFVL